ncbi:carboxypeptidase-like regulatory domain-containing protein [uncultured Methanobrevibacter sp.]|uniref:carboxypeptidase-like regulatory domain-containing protein n=1 Tax=uncultured Methanobrevibacter sp. TaxID=253161 RepID=UPI003207CDFF
MFSISTVFAGNNETVSDIVGTTDNLDDVVQLQDIPDTQSSKSDEQILTAGNNVINVVNVMDSYNETGKTWSEDGFNLKGATIKVYDSSDNVVSTVKTDSKGNAVIKNLGSSKYSLEVSYLTYEPQKYVVDFTKKSGTVDIKGIMFVPDILLLVDYNSHNEKVDLLMNMSRRIAYISTTDFDKSRAWLVEYANYMLMLHILSVYFQNKF